MLKYKQRKALLRLAQGEPAVSIARDLKLRPETLSRWQRNHQFNNMFAILQEEIHNRLRQRLLYVVDRSLTSISEQLDKESDDQTRIKTALNVLRIVGSGALNAPESVIKDTPQMVESVTPLLDSPAMRKEAEKPQKSYFLPETWKFYFNQLKREEEEKERMKAASMGAKEPE
jgi:hypothetical protein